MRSSFWAVATVIGACAGVMLLSEPVCAEGIFCTDALIYVEDEWGEGTWKEAICCEDYLDPEIDLYCEFIPT